MEDPRIGVVLHFTYQSVVELRHDYTDESADGNGVGSLTSRL